MSTVSSATTSTVYLSSSALLSASRRSRALTNSSSSLIRCCRSLFSPISLLSSKVRCSWLYFTSCLTIHSFTLSHDVIRCLEEEAQRDRCPHLVFPLHLPQSFTVVPHVSPQLTDLLLHGLSLPLPLFSLSFIPLSLSLRVLLGQVQGQLYGLLLVQTLLQSPLQGDTECLSVAGR